MASGGDGEAEQQVPKGVARAWGPGAKGPVGLGQRDPKVTQAVWCLLGRDGWAFTRNKRKIEERPSFRSLLFAFFLRIGSRA